MKKLILAFVVIIGLATISLFSFSGGDAGKADCIKKSCSIPSCCGNK
jgi:hypothetical protein